MNWLIAFAVIIVVQATPSLKTRFDAFSDQLIHYVNEKSGTSWRAARSTRFNSVEHMKQHLGALVETPEQRKSRRPTVRYQVSDSDLPESFDARKQWPNCPSISEIRDQSGCGSCWAFGAVGAMSDRVCIHSKGQMKPHLSARDLLSCCEFCGRGCRGGSPALAWDYWKSSGIVTGGSLEEPTGCAPYPFPKCAHHGSSGGYKPCPEEYYPTPTCHWKCQVGYNKTYDEDKFYAISSYNVYGGEKNIMYEIMKNGPVEASFDVFADFFVYKSGIYRHETGDFLGRHAIRLLGWGVEDGEKYWLIANSWNEEWGENGYFRIRRGTDECSIESRITTDCFGMGQVVTGCEQPGIECDSSELVITKVIRPHREPAPYLSSCVGIPSRPVDQDIFVELSNLRNSVDDASQNPNEPDNRKRGGWLSDCRRNWTLRRFTSTLNFEDFSV